MTQHTPPLRHTLKEEKQISLIRLLILTDFTDTWDTGRKKTNIVRGSQGFGGIGFHCASQGKEGKHRAESKLCGQTMAGAPEIISETSAAHGSVLEFRLSVTYPNVQLLTCIDFSKWMYLLCFLPEEWGWYVCSGNWSVCSAKELSPCETDTYSWDATLLCPPGNCWFPLDLLHCQTGVGGGADMQLWGTEKGLTTCEGMFPEMLLSNHRNSAESFAVTFSTFQTKREADPKMETHSSPN